jgi:hypothetical protein
MSDGGNHLQKLSRLYCDRWAVHMFKKIIPLPDVSQFGILSSGLRTYKYRQGTAAR